MDSLSLYSAQTGTSRELLFVNYLNGFIQEELSFLQSNDTCQERFIIFKQAFNKTLEFVQAYKTILNAIKHEYEFCIETLERGLVEAENMKRDLERAVTAPQTLLNLEKRKEELIARISQIKASNRLLLENLNALLSENEKYRPKKEAFESRFKFLSSIGAVNNHGTEEAKRSRVLNGLNIEQATDLEYLNSILNDLEIKIRELNFDQKTKYSMKMRKNELKNALLEKIAKRDELQLNNDSLKNKLHLYKIALQAAKNFYGGSIEGNSIQQILTQAIFHERFNKNSNKIDDEQPGQEQTDDNMVESEAEYILDYIDRFNEIFANGKYKDAAYFAVASPRNVLRNIETFNRFQTVSNLSLDDNDPLLLYVIALLDSINNDLSKPNEKLSIECVKVLLAHQRIDVLARYIAQRKIQFSLELARLIEQFSSLKQQHEKKAIELSLFIYNHIDCQFEAIVCLAKLGRFTTMLEKFNANYDEDVDELDEIFLKLLRECPTFELANFLIKEATDYSPPFDLILSTLDPVNQLKLLKSKVEKISIQKQLSNSENEEKSRNSYVSETDEPELVKQQVNETYEAEVYERNESFEDVKLQESQTEKIAHKNFHKFDGGIFDDDDDD